MRRPRRRDDFGVDEAILDKLKQPRADHAVIAAGKLLPIAAPVS